FGSVPFTRGPATSLLRRRKDLIRIWIRVGTLHAIEAKVGGLVTVVTCVSQAVVRPRKCRAIPLGHRRPPIGQWLCGHTRDRIFGSDRRILMRGMELDDVVEAFAELV